MTYQINARGDSTEVVMYGDIGEGWFGGISAADVHADVSKIRTSDIDVRLNTPGGSVDEGIAIANTLRNHEARVTVHVDSLAASIGSYIAVWGADEIVMASNARMMVHNAWTLVGGDANEFRRVADLLDLHNDILIDGYAARASISRDEVVEAMNAETWYNAEQAVEAGLADSVGESSLQMAAWFQPKRFRNTPEDLKQAAKPAASGIWQRMLAERRLRLTKAGKSQ